ncbi:hypothetical protein F5B20DRAFT_595307 [Whalleya microplaca]|nr:hypothetical protein F5B20DRAFT_595307 [Whalleya microplaca]
MSVSVISLNNGRLQDGPLPSDEYNRLPHVDDMRDVASQNAKAHAILLGMIAAEGLADKFSLHLIHKHFDVPVGRVMVYETIKGKDHSDFVLCSPRVPEKYPNMRGLYFKAVAGGNMVAYEYTTEPGADLSTHSDFVERFAEKSLELGAQDVFALTAIPICAPNRLLTEFEMANVLSTISLSDASWLPGYKRGNATPTDWNASEDYAKYADGSVPGIIQLQCIKEKDDCHYQFDCSTTRSGRHIGHAGDPFSGETPQEIVHSINGEPLQEGTEGFAVVTHALQLIEAA